MRGVTAVLGFVLGVLTLAGCGTSAAQPAGPATTGSTHAVPAGEAPRPGAPIGPQGGPAADTPGPTFPITLRRTGGIADFDDTVVLKTTGEVVVNTRTVRDRVCVLPRQQREQLFSVLSTLRHTGAPAAAPGGGSDVIRISLTDAHRHPFDLADPSLGSVSDLVQSFVSDVTLTSPATVACKTPGA